MSDAAGHDDTSRKAGRWFYVCPFCNYVSPGGGSYHRARFAGDAHARVCRPPARRLKHRDSWQPIGTEREQTSPGSTSGAAHREDHRSAVSSSAP